MRAVNLFNRFGRAAAAVALLALSTGCATFRDVRRDFQNLFSGRSDAARADPEDAFDAMGQRRPGRVISRDFNPRNLPATVRVITAMGENQAAAQQALEAGLTLYRRAVESRQAGETAQAAQRFQDAGNKLREAAAHWPDSPLEQDALFYQGEAFFFADQYVLADRAFEAITHSYSGSKYVDAANARRFAIAQYWLAVHDRGRLATWFNFSDKRLPTAGAAAEARRILHRIRLDDPTGKLADDATIALGNAFFKAHRWLEAADAYEDLRNSYPGSPFLFQSHLLELKARLNSYAGPKYDGEPLEKADQLMRAIVRQFPDELDKNRDYLTEEAGNIQRLLADRDLTVGQYYEGRGENRAAGIYYQAVAERFEGTPLAEEASERIAELKDKPEEPVQRVSWLVEMFPEAKATRPLMPNAQAGSVLR